MGNKHPVIPSVFVLLGYSIKSQENNLHWPSPSCRPYSGIHPKRLGCSSFSTEVRRGTPWESLSRLHVTGELSLSWRVPTRCRKGKQFTGGPSVYSFTLPAEVSFSLCEVFQNGFKLHPRELCLFFYVTIATTSSHACIPLPWMLIIQILYLCFSFSPCLTLVNVLNFHKARGLFCYPQTSSIGFLQY